MHIQESDYMAKDINVNYEKIIKVIKNSICRY